MSEREHHHEEDRTPMSQTEMWRCIRQHDRDLYRGNGLPGITTRLADLEAYKKRTERDLYHEEHGVVPQLTKFFAVLDEREGQASKTMNRYVAIMALVAVASPILWDITKHGFGWMAK